MSTSAARPGRPRLPPRPLAALVVASLALPIAVVAAPLAHGPRPTRAVNVLVVLTDDQPASTLDPGSAAMPWLAAQLEDPASGWVRYSNAVASTPMCCPSRATILTGRTALRTGVVDNHTGFALDESATIATALHDAGYRTGLVGKYLNEYPWDRGPYVAPGWDRWFAKTNEALATTYYGYPVVDQGTVRLFGRGPGDYVTDVLGREAFAFVRAAPTDRPWFLLFSPPAPHEPWTPAPRDADALVAGPAPSIPSTPGSQPAWMEALPPADEVAIAEARRGVDASLLAVDAHLRRLADLIAARGEWDRTLILVLSDNGMHLGERGWIGKRVPYEPSIRIPFAVRWPPGLDAAAPDTLVSNLDVAPTIAALAGVPLPRTDGVSLLGPVPADRTVPLWWVGDDEVPSWRGVRTPEAVLIAWSTGERELYDVADDPAEVVNRYDDPAWRVQRARLTALLPGPPEGPG